MSFKTMKVIEKTKSFTKNGDLYISSCNFSSPLFPVTSPAEWKSCHDAYEFTWSNDFNGDMVGLSELNLAKLTKSMGFCPQNRCQLFNLSNSVTDNQCPNSLCYTKVEDGGLSYGACCFQQGEFNYGHLIGYYNKTTFTPKPIYKKSRVVLGDSIGGADESYSSFINANRVHPGIIVSQCPLHSTINDVKRMIVEQNISQWIQLAPYSLDTDPMQHVYNGQDLKTDCAVFPNVYLNISHPFSEDTADYAWGVTDLRRIDSSSIGLVNGNNFMVQTFTLTYFSTFVGDTPYITFRDMSDIRDLDVLADPDHTFPSSSQYVPRPAPSSSSFSRTSSQQWTRHSRTVEHVWYSHWADFEVPAAADHQNLNRIARRSADILRSNGHISVSCQSGRGRSGTFSALVLSELHAVSSHDQLVNLVVGMREHRDGLVETPAQFRFVTEAYKGLSSSAYCGTYCGMQQTYSGNSVLFKVYFAFFAGCILVLLPVLYLVKHKTV
jgi:hypothetical protein